MLNLTPRMSEKAYQQSLLNNTYIFVVPKDSNKLQIKTAVVQNGKKARSIRLGNRRARPIIGSRSDFKKAYVRLKEGDSIKIFEEEGDK